MTPYLIKNPHRLVQYIASNLLPKRYHFCATSWIPEDKDPLLTDAKLLLTYDAHLSKEKQYRRRKAGLATVRYLRCGQLCLLFATKGDSSFFQRESWFDLREKSLHVAGHALRVTKEGRASVRIHEEAQRELRKEAMELAGQPVGEVERWLFNLPYLPFRGVQDNVFALVRHVNECRRLLKKLPVDANRCIRRKIKSEPVFLETPEEIEALLRYEVKSRSLKVRR